ncbi:MAG: hypothetical protein ABSB19_02150 [Methylomonas sp.]|jgi:hypothetical protein
MAIPLFKALFCQILAAGVIFLFSPWLVSKGINGWLLIFSQAAIAGGLSGCFRQPSWWRAINFMFLPALIAMLALQLPVWLYLFTFLALTLIFWGTVSGDAPLFLSSRQVADAVLTLVRREQAANFAEIGAGIGTVILPLARNMPGLRILGLEQAPLPWFLAKWRCRRCRNAEIRLSSLWSGNLADFAVVFAFLSPLVMARVGEKVRRDMPNGGLFISAAFPVPDWLPESIIEIADSRKTNLYCYRIQADNAITP